MSGLGWYKKGVELLEEISATPARDGQVAFWFLGQESMVFKGPEGIVYVDPYFTDHPGRNFPPPFDPADVTDADLVLCTHDHLDHLDVGTLGPMARSAPRARFVAPAPHLGRLAEAGIEASRCAGARAGEPMEAAGIRITPVAAAHETFETDERGDHLYLGYVFDLGGVRLYHAGDTVEYPQLRETLAPLEADVAFLPINGRDESRRRRHIAGNLNFREAADLADAIDADLVVPLHFDLFKGKRRTPPISPITCSGPTRTGSSTS